MTIKYQIQGRDPMFGTEYSLPELYDTYDAAFAKAHSNHEWVRKVEEIALYAEGKKAYSWRLPA